jgi:hypothetical protein
MATDPTPREGKQQLMSHDAKHAPQPQPGSPDPAQLTSQAPRTESAHAPREPGISTDGPDRKPGPDLIPQGDRDKLTLRLQQALTTFVDSPLQAVEEADTVLDDVATRFTDTLTERRRVLRASWQDQDTEAQTEGTAARTHPVPGDHRPAAAHVGACQSLILSPPREAQPPRSDRRTPRRSDRGGRVLEPGGSPPHGSPESQSRSATAFGATGITRAALRPPGLPYRKPDACSQRSRSSPVSASAT